MDHYDRFSCKGQRYVFRDETGKHSAFCMVENFISYHTKNNYAHLAERKTILRIPLGREEFRFAKFFIN